MNKFLLLFAASILLPLSAGTIRLVNDSPYKLKAVIRAADGTYLGEMILSEQHSGMWTDFGNSNPGGLGNQDRYSQTPYTVMWFCIGGKDFSVCDSVSTGSTVTALVCPGARSCPTVKPQAEPEGASPKH